MWCHRVRGRSQHVEEDREKMGEVDRCQDPIKSEMDSVEILDKFGDNRIGEKYF